MTEGSGLYLAGPSLVKAAIGQVVDAEELGGAKMHSEISGTVDFYEKDDQSCLKRLRSLVALLPEAEAAKHKEKSKSHAPAKKPEAVYDLISLDGHKPYDARDLLASIIDGDSLDEYKADYGKTLVTGLPAGRLGSSRASASRCARKKKESRWAASSMPTARTKRRALSWTATKPGCRLSSSRM
jgi:acetyl-CoA carboxylase carboxyltransferase component